MNEKVSTLLVLSVRTVVLRYLDSVVWQDIALLLIDLLQMLVGK